MAEFDKNCDQVCNGWDLPTYQNSKRVNGLQISFTSEASYVEPWSVIDFKKHAYIDTDTDDNLLTFFLKAARIDVENYIQRSLGIRTVKVMALVLPKNYLLPWGPVQAIATAGFTKFGEIVIEGGKDVTIEYTTNASLVNDSIKQAIYKQAFNYYENRDSVQPSGLDSVTKIILQPYRRMSFP